VVFCLVLALCPCWSGLLSGLLDPLGCSPVLGSGLEPGPFGLRLAGGTGGSLLMLLSFGCLTRRFPRRLAFANHCQDGRFHLGEPNDTTQSDGSSTYFSWACAMRTPLPGNARNTERQLERVENYLQLLARMQARLRARCPPSAVRGLPRPVAFVSFAGLCLGLGTSPPIGSK
jgi:hypothetical protein